MAAFFLLLASAAVDVPSFDDYEAVVAFLVDYVEAEGARERLRLVFAQHIEHRPAVLRSAVVLVHAVTGRLDFRVLDVVGGLFLPLLLAALYAAFATGERAATRLPAFAPAAPFLLHPQFWSAFHWPTCSATNFAAVAFAALAFALLARDGRAAFAGALAAGFAATFSQGNGILVLPLGALIPWLRDRPGRALAWLAAAGALLVVTLLSWQRPFDAWSPGPALAVPDRALLYLLNFVGSAAAFSVPGLAVAAGLGLVAAFTGLALRGLPRRNPALFALLLFLFASAAMNALVRAQQGAGAPLAQPRYRFYASALLATTYLAGVETLRSARARRSAVAAGTALSIAFCAASWALYRRDALDFGARLRDGLDHWWRTGEAGLVHPRPAVAGSALLAAMARDLMAVPQRWVGDPPPEPVPVELPAAGHRVAFEIGTLAVGADQVLVDGWAYVDGDARGQRVLLVFDGPGGPRAYETHAVQRSDLAGAPASLVKRVGRSGFRIALPRSALPVGRYRVGVLVLGPSAPALGWRPRPLEVEAG